MRHLVKSRALAITARAAAMLLWGTSDAQAAQWHTVTSTAICEAALPAYDAVLRKRPLGITNQGSADIFISCALPVNYDPTGDDASAPVIGVHFSSDSAVARTVSGTLVMGSRGQSSWTVGATDVPANGGSSIAWGESSIVWGRPIPLPPLPPNNFGGNFNFSCILPPGIEMNAVSWTEDPSWALP